MQPDRDVIAEYFGHLFGQVLEEYDDLYYSVFALPSARPAFFRDVGAGVDWCSEQVASGEDVYCGMALLRARPRGGSRGNADDTHAIVSLWTDLDIAHAAHKSRKPYPESVEEALELGSVCGHMRPSFYTHTGHGIHTYWRFKEPWVFEGRDDRHDAEMLVQRWGATVHRAAAAKGRQLDSVYDLARILRVAGTVNFKEPDVPKKVTLHEITGAEYDPSEIEPFLVAAEYARQGRTVVPDVDQFDVLPDVQVDERIIEALSTNDNDFRATWAQTRSDLSDQSASSYDMALANTFVRVGWTDQQIVDALIHWRRIRGHAPKNRVDYYQRTIGKARASLEQKKAYDELQSGDAQMPTEADRDNLTSTERATCLNGIRGALRIAIQRFVQVNKDQAEYFIVLDDGTQFSVGKVRNVTSFGSFRDRILERCGVSLEPKMSKVWHEVVKRLFLIVEREEADEPTTEERSRSLLETYLSNTRVFSEEEWTKALRDGSPMTKDGLVWVHKDTFARWCRVTTGDRITAREIERDFRLLGMEPFKHQARDRGARVNRWYWGAPLDDYPAVAEMAAARRRKVPEEEDG